MILKYGQSCLGDDKVGDKKVSPYFPSVSFFPFFRKRVLALTDPGNNS